MNVSSDYDVVLAIDYPHGESSDRAYDTWARIVRQKVSAVFDGDFDVTGVRAVRSHNHLKISIQVSTWPAVTSAISVLLGAVHDLAPADLLVRVHECHHQKTLPPQLSATEVML